MLKRQTLAMVQANKPARKRTRQLPQNDIGLWLLLATLCLTGCKSLSHAIDGEIGRIRNPAVSGDPCGHADWFEVGRVDGLSGIQIEQSAYIGRCEAQGMKVDRELYLAGWQRGLLDYCTPERGFDAGRSGQFYQGICPSHVEAQFLKRFEIGHKVAALEKENSAIERRVDSMLRELERLDRQLPSTQPSILNDALNTTSKSNVQNELQALRDARARNDFEIKNLESSAAL